MMNLSILYYLACFILTTFLLLILQPFLRKYFLVKPNLRGSHTNPTPTGGGISFVLVSSFGMLFLRNYIPIICLPLGIIGFIDDLKDVDFRLRFLFQFSTGLAICFCSKFLLNDNFNINNFTLIATYFFIAFLVTSIINFTNFVDGIDGLLTLSLIIIFSVSAIKINTSIWVIVSTLLAFLLFNWQPSKVFMGDVGSTYLGAIYSSFLIQATSLQDSFFVLLPSIPILADAFLCVIRRFFAKQNIFKAHSLHLFQRLYQAGWSHSEISILYGLAAFSLGICSLLNFLSLSILLIISIFLIGFYLDRKVAISFHSSLIQSNK